MNEEEKKPNDEPFLKIVRRKEWGANKPRYYELIYTPVHYVILRRYTRTEPCYTDEDCKKTLREIQERHQKRLEYTDIAYNFLIGGDGTIYKGRGWKFNAERPNDRYKKYSGKCMDIAYIGDFRRSPPPEVMTQAAEELINYGVKKCFIEELYETVTARKS